jgi:flagellar hook-associated protein 1 FlgK
MSINFSAMEIGRRALNANQLGINITGQNISNVNTPGYTRQRVQLTEAAPTGVSGYAVGAGVTIAGVRNFRDSFIESRIQTETGIAGRLSAQRDALAPVETALQGTDNGGLQNAINNFFGSFRDLEANPGSVSLRAVVAQRGSAVASAFQVTRSRLDDARRAADEQLRSTVGEVNSLSEKIAVLNSQIRTAEHSGETAAALRDQRGELLNQISELSGARSIENEDGTVTVTIGEGRALVMGDKALKLQAESQPPMGLAIVTLDGQPAVFNEGKARGFQNAISDITAQIDSLDGLAAAVAEKVDELHTAGTDLDGNAGINFFNNPPPAVSAANISINTAIMTNPRLIVASPLAQPNQNGTVAGQIADLLTDAGTTVGTRSGSFVSIFGAMIAEAGEKIRAADDGLQTQAAIIAQTSAQRDAVSGVSLDEEAINLLQYQRAYQAAARFIKVADEMTQTILSLAQ